MLHRLFSGLALGALAALALEGVAMAQMSTRTATTPTTGRVGANLEILDVDKVTGVAMGGSAFGDYNLDETFAAGASIGYWAGENRDEPVNYRVSDLLLGVHLRGVFAQVMTGVQPYGQVGIDMHRLSVNLDEETTSPLSSDTQRDETRFGVRLGGGALIALQEGLDATLGLQYRQVIADKDIRFNQLSFAGGLAYAL